MYLLRIRARLAFQATTLLVDQREDTMKLGLTIYRHHINERDLAFARQTGATHVAVHLVDYTNQGDEGVTSTQPIGGSTGWGVSGDADKLWEVDDLMAIKRQINAAGLEWYAVENFETSWWYDILLGGPERDGQIEKINTIIRRVGEAGIPVIGYAFNLPGVWGRSTELTTRGGAKTVGMDGHVLDDSPLPLGMLSNMVYDVNAPEGTLEPVSNQELWDRLGFWLDAAIPVAEEAGVTLAAHPDDPPIPVLRGQPRLITQHTDYRRVTALNPSSHNKYEFCLGTLAEMNGGDLYAAVDEYAMANRIAYVHFRNVEGTVPNYQETFVDDGDTDMLRIMRILYDNNFDGIIVPDHSPPMSCDAPWHASMAFTMGYMRAALQSVEGS